MGNEIEKIKELTRKVDGRIAPEEARLLYLLARDGEGQGKIIEIGSYQGYSTIWLASGSKEGGREEVYAIDPHNMEDHGYNEGIFKNNIKEAEIDDYVVPIVATSAEAEKGWDEPIRLLFIDGAHDYENARNDFTLWESHLIPNGIVACHDYLSMSCPGVTRVVKEFIFDSDHYSVMGCVNTVLYARKVESLTPLERIEKESFFMNLLSRQSAENNYQKAEHLINEGRYDEAEPLLDESEKIIDKFFSQMYRIIRLNGIAGNFKKIGKYQKAERIYREILTFDNVPFLEKYSALLNLGDIYYTHKNYHDAIQKFKEALNIEGITDGKKTILIMGIGLCYSEQGRNEEAEFEYKKALSFKNVSHTARQKLLMRLGNIFFAGGRYEEAKQVFTDALSTGEVKENERFHLLFGLGRCHYVMKRYQVAEENYKEALYIDDMHAENKVNAVLEFGKCYSDQGRKDEEESLYLNALTYEGFSNILRYRLLCRLGNIYLQRGLHEEAEQRFTEALSLEDIPEIDRYHALLGLGKCYLSLGRYRDAQEQYEMALSYKDISNDIRLSIENHLMECFFALGKFHEIEETCGRVLSLSGISDHRKRDFIKRTRDRLKLLYQHQGDRNA
jgi:tetratricopeptide (TPR) repeat protein